MAYIGKFTIITAGGSEVEVSGTLMKSSGPGLKSWRGEAAGNPADAAELDPGMVRLRLPDGSEADALVQDTSHRIARDVGQSLILTLVGSGPPPF